MQNDHFSEEEVKEVLGRSLDLINRGFFTGINLIESQSPLPDTSVTVHYNQDSEEQVDHVASSIRVPSLKLPRRATYIFKPKYGKKPTFFEEYRNAEFYDRQGNRIPIEKARNTRVPLITVNPELDLIVPITGDTRLDDVIAQVMEANESGPAALLEPALIVKSKNPLPERRGFESRSLANLAKRFQEFYSIISDEIRKAALEKYLGEVCPKLKVGTLTRDSIVFYPSQVNKSLIDYIESIQPPLQEN